MKPEYSLCLKGMQSYNKFSGFARETKNKEKDYI